MQGVVVACLYLPNGNPQPGPKFDDKLARFERLIAHAARDFFRQHWQRDAGLRIDHLLPNRRLAPALRSAGVDRWVRGEAQASDHAPTWAAFDWPG